MLLYCSCICFSNKSDNRLRSVEFNTVRLCIYVALLFFERRQSVRPVISRVFLKRPAVNMNRTDDALSVGVDALNVVELAGEVLIAISAVIGNGLVLIAIATAHSLRTVTNFYVASLATADLLVGLLGKQNVCHSYFEILKEMDS